MTGAVGTGTFGAGIGTSTVGTGIGTWTVGTGTCTVGIGTWTVGTGTCTVGTGTAGRFFVGSGICANAGAAIAIVATPRRKYAPDPQVITLGTGARSSPNQSGQEIGET